MGLGFFLFVGPSSHVVPCIARSLRSVALCRRRELRLPLSLSLLSSIQQRLGSLPRLAFQNEPRTLVQHPKPRAYSQEYSSCHGLRAGRGESGKSRPRRRARQSPLHLFSAMPSCSYESTC